MVLKQHSLLIDHSKYFHLPGHVGKHEPETFALSVLDLHRVLYDLKSFFQRNLEMIHHACHWTTLEYIVRDYSDSSQLSHKLSHDMAVIIDAFEQNCLVADRDANG